MMNVMMKSLWMLVILMSVKKIMMVAITRWLQR